MPSAKRARRLSRARPARAGGSAKLAAAIVQLANAADPPLRLPLGEDALGRIAEKNAFVERETAKWRTLSESTSY